MCICYLSFTRHNWSQHMTSLSSVTRGHGSRFQYPRCSSTVFSNSYFPHTIRDWNCLPTDPASSCSLDAFKNVLRRISYQMSSHYIDFFTGTCYCSARFFVCLCHYLYHACTRTQCDLYSFDTRLRTSSEEEEEEFWSN